MIQLNDIVVKFGDFTALHNINVHVKEGEFFTFLGPSGCGKTTTLRTVTGFIEPVSGSVVVKGRDITHVPIEDALLNRFPAPSSSRAGTSPMFPLRTAILALSSRAMHFSPP